MGFNAWAWKEVFVRPVIQVWKSGIFGKAALVGGTGAIAASAGAAVLAKGDKNDAELAAAPEVMATQNMAVAHENNVLAAQVAQLEQAAYGAPVVAGPTPEIKQTPQPPYMAAGMGAQVNDIAHQGAIAQAQSQQIGV